MVAAAGVGKSYTQQCSLRVSLLSHTMSRPVVPGVCDNKEQKEVEQVVEEVAGRGLLPSEVEVLAEICDRWQIPRKYAYATVVALIAAGIVVSLVVQHD